jgi:hypothetical protein
MHQLRAQVLIAAILLRVIRADEMTPAGACREWPKPADDRRGGERVPRDRPVTRSVRTRSAQFRRPTRVARRVGAATAPARKDGGSHY